MVALVAGLAVGRFLTARGQPGAAVSPGASVAGGDHRHPRGPGFGRSRGCRRPDNGSGSPTCSVRPRWGTRRCTPQRRGSFVRPRTLAPGDPRTMTALGVLALARHDFDDALRLGLAAHASDPFSADPLAVVVDAEVELGEYEAAANHLQQMLDLRPGLAALSRTSYLRELHGDLEGAIEAMEQARLAGSGSVFDVALVTALSGNLMLLKGDLESGGDGVRRSRAAGTRSLARPRLGAPESNWPRGTSKRRPQALCRLRGALPHSRGCDPAGRDACGAGSPSRGGRPVRPGANHRPAAGGLGAGGRSGDGSVRGGSRRPGSSSIAGDECLPQPADGPRRRHVGVGPPSLGEAGCSAPQDRGSAPAGIARPGAALPRGSGLLCKRSRGASGR